MVSPPASISRSLRDGSIRRWETTVAPTSVIHTRRSPWLERITIDPTVMSGKPCIRGMRVTVANVLRQLANHRTVDEILKSYPYLHPEDKPSPEDERCSKLLVSMLDAKCLPLSLFSLRRKRRRPGFWKRWRPGSRKR